MKKYIALITCTIFAVIFSSLPADAWALFNLKIGKGKARVVFLDGSAQVQSSGQGQWRTLKLQDALQGGDEVKTGAKTKLEISLPDNSRVRFAGNSRFRVNKMDVGDDKPTNINIHMAIGKGWANVAKAIGGKKNFELTCENAVAGVRGTVYRMNVNDDQSALVKVYDGNVYVSGGGKEVLEQPHVVSGAPQKIAGPTVVEGPKKVTMEQWTVIIKAMQQIRIGGDGKAGQPEDFTEAEDRDDWVDWNKARDNEIAR
ncbi:MAG: FecR family protein [Smithellaceae bacterium]|nr:FecR family protein [Smithellaceae bacterium]